MLEQEARREQHYAGQMWGKGKAGSVLGVDATLVGGDGLAVV